MEWLEKALKKDTSLQRFSMISIATSAWEEATIKDKIRYYFLSKRQYTSQENLYSVDEEWCKINKDVLHQLDSIPLPNKVLLDIKDISFFIGEKIFGWSQYVTNDLGLDFKYAEKIYWTNYGTIDESKIFKSFWQNDKELQSSKKSLNYLKSPLYTIACIFGEENFICCNMKDMVEAVDMFCKSSKLPKKDKWNLYDIMAVGIYCFLKDDNGKYDRYSRLRNEDFLLSPLDSLSLWSSAGFYAAVKFLITEYKEISNDDIAFLLDCKFRRSNDENNIFKIEKQAELFLLFLNSMTVKQRNIVFFRNNLKIASLLLQNWPFQDVFLPVLYYMFSSSTEYDQSDLSDWRLSGSRTLTEYFLEDIIPLIIECISKEFKSKFDVRKRVYLKIFKEIWTITPVNLKKKFIVKNTSFRFELYYYDDDYQTLSLIVNDPELKDHRQNLIKSGDKIFSRDVKKGRFERVNKFIENVLIYESDVEKKDFKNKFNFLFELAFKENFETADKLAHWLSDSDEEKVELKKKINPVKLCSMYIYSENEKFDVKVIDRLLNWQFGEDSTLKKKVIDIVKHESLIRDEFLKVWGAKCSISIDSAKDSCIELLKWFLGLDEINAFMKNEVVDDQQFFESFFRYLQSPDDFDTIHHLFEFCQTPPEKIKSLKQKVNSDMAFWIEYHGIKLKNFRIVNKIFSWCFLNDIEKKEAIGKYVNSEKGAELCIEVFNYSTTYFPDPVVILFNSWIKQYGDIATVISNCERLKNSEFSYKFTETCISNVVKLLDRLRKREFITVHDAVLFISTPYHCDDDDSDLPNVHPCDEEEYEKIYSGIFN